MFFNLRILSLIIFISALFLISCSSTTVQKRYNKSEKEKKKVDNSIRFTDENDTAPAKNEVSKLEFDEDPIEENPIDVKRFVSENSVKTGSSTQLSDREKILYEIVKYINTRYQYGGDNKKGIDCSAFTKNVYSNSINYTLPRTASEQFEIGKAINSENNLVFGDLVFFDTTQSSYPGHVGIYLGDDLFAHSSSSKGVTISAMNNNYYQTRYVGGRRTNELSH